MNKTSTVKQFTSGELKNFGLLVGGMLLIMAIWPMIHQMPVRFIFLLPAISLLIPLM
jgi:hypothetical protein